MSAGMCGGDTVGSTICGDTQAESKTYNGAGWQSGLLHELVLYIARAYACSQSSYRSTSKLQPEAHAPAPPLVSQAILGEG